MDNLNLSKIIHIKASLSNFRCLTEYNLNLEKVEVNLEHYASNGLNEFLSLPNNIQCNDMLSISPLNELSAEIGIDVIR